MKKIFNLTIDRENKDLKILGNSLNAKGFSFDTQWYIKNGEVIESENPEIRGSSHCTDTSILEGNYIRINGLKVWEDSNHKNLLEAIELANKSTKEYRFEFGDIADYEMEYGGDRDYPASFTFYSHKK